MKEKVRESTGTLVLRANIWRTEVKNPWGKKKAEIQYSLGFYVTPFRMNLTLYKKSSNQE